MAWESIRRILGLALMLYSMTQLGVSVWLTTRGVAAWGRAVDTVSYMRIVSAPMVEFASADDRLFRIVGRLQPQVSLLEAPKQTAEPVGVLYDRDDPRLALVVDPVELWMRPWAVLFFGLFLLYVGRLWHWIMD